MINKIDEKDRLETGGPLPPEPPNNGGGDPWEDDPEGKPSLLAYLKMSVAEQAAWYSKVLRHRVILQRLHLRETAEHMAEGWAELQHGRAATEHEIRREMAFLADHQKYSLREADEWLVNPSKFRLSWALAHMYSAEYLSGGDELSDWFIDLTERLMREEEQR